MNKRNTIIMIVLFFIGLLTLFYPTLSNYYNEKMGSKTIYNYENILNSYDIDKFKQIKKVVCLATNHPNVLNRY